MIYGQEIIQSTKEKNMRIYQKCHLEKRHVTATIKMF